MATANLVGKDENSPVSREPDGLKTVIKCLRHGLDGQVWAGITWTSYSSLLPLANLTVSDTNKEILNELGLVTPLLAPFSACAARCFSVLPLPLAAPPHTSAHPNSVSPFLPPWFPPGKGAKGARKGLTRRVVRVLRSVAPGRALSQHILLAPRRQHSLLGGARALRADHLTWTRQAGRQAGRPSVNQSASQPVSPPVMCCSVPS